MAIFEIRHVEFLGVPWESLGGVFNDVSSELKKQLKITCQIWGTLFNSPKLEDLKLVRLGEDVGIANVFGENTLNEYSCRCQMLCTRPRFARESAVFVNDIWFSLMAFLFLSHMSILCHFTLLAISVVNFINPWLLGFVVSSDLHRKRVKNVHLTCEFALVSCFFLGETEWPHVTKSRKRRVLVAESLLVYIKINFFWGNWWFDKCCNSPSHLLYVSVLCFGCQSRSNN